MKSCPYIKFGNIFPPNSLNKGASAIVYRRSKIANALELSEAQFIEFVILLGNDYTSQFLRSDYIIISNEENVQVSTESLPEGYSLRVSEQLLEFIQMMGHGCILSSNNPQLQQAIEFSRTLYELGDISKYPVDGDGPPSPMSLSSIQKEELLSWLKVQSVANDDENIGWIAIKFLKEKSIDNFELFDIPIDTISSIDTMLQEIDVMNNNNVTSSTTTNNNNEGNRELLLRNNNNKYRPCWEDLFNIHLYQQICKTIYRHFDHHNDKKGKYDLIIQSYEPKLVYDGTIFHNIRKIYYENKHNTKEISSTTTTSATTNTSKVSSSKDTPPTSTGSLFSTKLPIDAFHDEIISRVARDRVTVIHGETGCGKSSRLPAMLYEDATSKRLV